MFPMCNSSIIFSVGISYCFVNQSYEFLLELLGGPTSNSYNFVAVVQQERSSHADGFWPGGRGYSHLFPIQGRSAHLFCLEQARGFVESARPPYPNSY